MLIADDYAVTNGRESCAQALFRVISRLCIFPQRVDCSLKRVRDHVQAAPREKSDQKPDECRTTNDCFQCVTDLRLPVLNLILPLQLLLADELVENIAEAIHLIFPTQVESDISSIPTRPNQRDHRNGGRIKPALVSNHKLIEKMSILAMRCKVVAKRGNGAIKLALCLLVGLKERFVRCVLKPAQPTLLVDCHREDVGRGRYVVIGVLKIIDSLLSIADLPDERARDKQKRHHGKQQSLQ